MRVARLAPKQIVPLSDADTILLMDCGVSETRTDPQFNNLNMSHKDTGMRVGFLLRRLGRYVNPLFTEPRQNYQVRSAENRDIAEAAPKGDSSPVKAVQSTRTDKQCPGVEGKQTEQVAQVSHCLFSQVTY